MSGAGFIVKGVRVQGKEIARQTQATVPLAKQTQRA